MSANAQTRAGPSTMINAPSRDSVATDATRIKQDPPTLPPDDVKRIAGPPPPAPFGGSGDLNNNAPLKFGILEKLQTYLPTGTWLIYTAFQAWVLTIRPAPPPPRLVCSSRQKLVVIVAIVLAALSSFISSFIKSFVYDASGQFVLYPPPNLFTVKSYMTDPVTGIKFPCRTRHGRYCWPLPNDANELTYNAKGALRVLIFKHGMTMEVQRPHLFKRISRYFFPPEQPDEIPIAPRLAAVQSTAMPGRKSISLMPRRDTPEVVLEIDDLLTVVPILEPRWNNRILGSRGTKSYIDLGLPVLEHALISLIAFIALALFSPEINDCLFPSVPAYISTLVQTILLVLTAFVSVMFLRDNAVSLGQATPQHIITDSAGMPIPINEKPVSPDSRPGDDVPLYLRSVVEGVVWVERFQDVQATLAGDDRHTQVPGTSQTQAGVALPERSREKMLVRNGIYADVPIGNLINYGE